MLHVVPDVWGTLLVHGLRFAQRRHTRNSFVLFFHLGKILQVEVFINITEFLINWSNFITLKWNSKRQHQKRNQRSYTVSDKLEAVKT